MTLSIALHTHILRKYTSLTARRLHVMVQEFGYSGSASHFRHLLASLRPRRTPEAYLRLLTLHGELVQVDWTHFGDAEILQTRHQHFAGLNLADSVRVGAQQAADRGSRWYVDVL